MVTFIEAVIGWHHTLRPVAQKFKDQFLQCQEVPDHIQIIYKMSPEHCPLPLPLIMDNNASCLNYISEASHSSNSYFVLLQVHKIF
jgi:hypothetical protein